jgi:hypothetical protein
MSDQGTRVTLLVLLSVVLVFSFGSIRLYVSKRKCFPIPQRYPIWVLVESTFLTVLAAYLLRCRAFYDDPSICGCDLVLWVEVLEHIPLAILCTRMAMLIIKDFYTKMMIGNQEAFLGGTESQHRDISLKGSYSLKFVEDILIWLISKLGILRTALLVLTPVYINQVIDVSLSFSHIHDMAGILYKDRACFELIYQKISFVKTAVFVYLGIVLSFVIVPVIRLKDNLFIGLELRLLLIGCIAVVVLFKHSLISKLLPRLALRHPLGSF